MGAVGRTTLPASLPEQPEASSVVNSATGAARNAATVGPQVGRRLAGELGTPTSLHLTATMAALNLFALLVGVLTHNAGFVWGMVFVFINGTLSRARMVILQAQRQVFFKGEQYTRIMSWSFAFGGAGGLIGLNTAYFAGLPDNPTIVLIIAIALWIILYPFVTSSKGRRENTTSPVPAPSTG